MTQAGSTLLRLSIADVGLIADAEIEFGSGLTAITGETGSGKTMLLGALELALGGRAETDLVRGGADRARVSLEIAPDDAMRERLAAAGFVLAPDDDLIVTREVLASGRSQARINGQPASASQVRDFAGGLVDIVSQHEAQRLLTGAYALDVIDRFSGAPALDMRARVRAAFAEARAARERLTALRTDDGAARAEFARFALAEIDAARIEDDGEDERLRARRDVIANAERILAALTTAHAALGDDAGAVDALGAAETALSALTRFGASFTELARATSALQSDVNELTARIASERDAIDVDPAERDTIGERLDTLDTLKRKYGGTLAAVLARREAFLADVADVDERDARLAAADAAVTEAESQLVRAAGELSALRVAAAQAFAADVSAELGALAMPAAQLRVALEPAASIGAHGAERAELRFRANAGESDRPLARVASGGELSRVLLALTVVLADRRERTALVFDEVDAGVGGATASAVGARLARLGTSGQVVCVTHLAQIASAAQTQIALRKHEADGVTQIDAVLLDERARRIEIARMLAGDVGDVALAHAAELLSVHAK
jgi:DNA repair protein RecN (Recombination protein N)